MNAIGSVLLETPRPLVFDPYQTNRITGSFILIDPATNATVAAGMITGAGRSRRSRKSCGGTPSRHLARTCGAAGTHGAVLSLGYRHDLAWRLERALFDRGCSVFLLDEDAAATAAELARLGILAVVLGTHDQRLTANTAGRLGTDPFRRACRTRQTKLFRQSNAGSNASRSCALTSVGAIAAAFKPLAASEEEEWNDHVARTRSEFDFAGSGRHRPRRASATWRALRYV